MNNYKDGKEITLDGGLKGTLWVAKNEDEKLSFFELLLSGKKYGCAEEDRKPFQEHLASIPDQRCDISFLHSITCEIDAKPRRRKKVEPPPVRVENKSVQYNCTVKVSKQLAQSMFEGMAVRLSNVAKLIAEGIVRDKILTPK